MSMEGDRNLERPWTEEEDAILLAHVAREGESTWNRVGKKMGIDRSGFSCYVRWNTYLKPKLNAPTPGPGPKGTEQEEVKPHNQHSLLHSTATPAPTTSQNVGVLPMHVLSGIKTERSMFSSGVPIHGQNEMKSQNLHSALHSTPTRTPIHAPPQNVTVLPSDDNLTGLVNNSMFSSGGVPIHGNREVNSQNLHYVSHSTPNSTTIPAPYQNVSVLPMGNIFGGITNKTRMFSSGVPIQQNKRFRAAEDTTYNPHKMFLKPRTELDFNNYSAAIETQHSAAPLSGEVLNSNLRELPSVQRNATLPERISIPPAIAAQLPASIQSGNELKSDSTELPSNTAVPKRTRLLRTCYANDVKLIPTSYLTASNANQNTPCNEHERYIAPVPSDPPLTHGFSDVEHAISDGGTTESDFSIISQGTNYPVEEPFEHIEKRVMSESMDALLGKSAEKETSESQLAPSSVVKDEVEGCVDHLFREFEMLVQNSDANPATSDEGMTEGSRSITPQGTDHPMEEQPGQTEKQETSKNLSGECGKPTQYSGADEIDDESRYFSNEEDGQICSLLKGFVQSGPSPYLDTP